MTFNTSIVHSRSKKIFLTFFALASLLPILIAVFIMRQYVLPSCPPKMRSV